MQELFADMKPARENPADVPLADRIRPKTIDEVVGQEHLTGEGAPLRLFFDKKDFPSMIFWGPPGVGKTTLALLISGSAGHNFVRLSAVEAGVKDVRDVIAAAGIHRKSGRKTLLFIDEIHRFNKSQQDALLHAVEKGIITLIGATTENPSFEVNSALLSRCQVYKLRPLENEDILKLIHFAFENDYVLSQYKIELQSPDFLLDIAGGDARSALNAIELVVKLNAKKDTDEIIIDAASLERALQQKTAQYDKKGENHYDTISAFIKSLRGSDPDAAMLWMAKMLDAGEDPKFIARRLVIFASEDIGNADPFALQLAVTVFRAVEVIGMPECRINLAQGVTYLASAPKSNSSYMAIDKALADVRGGERMSVPLHLRNAPTKLMKQEGYHEGYQYPHSFDGHFVKENYFPDGAAPRAYYRPGDFGREKQFRERLEMLWPERYKTKKK